MSTPQDLVNGRILEATLEKIVDDLLGMREITTQAAAVAQLLPSLLTEELAQQVGIQVAPLLIDIITMGYVAAELVNIDVSQSDQMRAQAAEFIKKMREAAITHGQEETD